MRDEKREKILELVREYYREKNEDNKIFIPGVSPIHASGITVRSKDIVSIVNTALDGWFTEFKACEQFRLKLKAHLDKKHCVLTNSGSSASLVAMSTMLELFPSRKFVLTTALAFPTTVAPIYQNNSIPIYVDVDLDTLSPNMSQVETFIKKHNVSGAIFTHTMGVPYPEHLVRELLGEDKFLISDGCDALGARVKQGDALGNYSDMLTLSFFPAHQISTAGEGGAVLFNKEEYYKPAFSFVNWGKSCYCSPGQDNICGKRFSHVNQGKLPYGYDHKYVFDRIGYNLKMTELQAAMGGTQIDFIDSEVTARRENYLLLYLALSQDNEEYLTVGSTFPVGNSSPFGFPIYVKEGAPFTAKKLIAYLEDHKIRTRRFFAGNITKQPGYKDMPYIYTNLSVTDYIMNNGFWIGCHSGITTQMVEYVKQTMNDFMSKYK